MKKQMKFLLYNWEVCSADVLMKLQVAKDKALAKMIEACKMDGYKLVGIDDFHELESTIYAADIKSDKRKFLKNELDAKATTGTLIIFNKENVNS